MTSVPVNTDELSTLTWPRAARDVPATEAVSLDVLLQALQLASKDEDRKAATARGIKWDAPTPASMQVIKSGTLGITKTGTKFVAGLGGGTGLLAVIAGTVTAFMDEVGEPVTVTLFAGAAVLLSAVVLALALFVSGDLQARGVATAARHAGRSEVASAFLNATATMPGSEPRAPTAQATSMATDFLAAFTALPGKTQVTTRRYDTPTLVTAVARTPDDTQLQLKLANGDWVGVDEITRFTTEPSSRRD